MSETQIALYEAFVAGYTAAASDQDFSDLDIALAYERWVN